MRVILIVLDSLGVGALPDADLYNDSGSNTLGHIATHVEGGINLPRLAQMGLGNILPVHGVGPVEESLASYGKSGFISAGKDTITGHWELTGIHLKEAFPVFPKGFPPALMDVFTEVIGTKTLGNKVASGTEIMAELGEVHVKTGYPIVYTSADSVFQIAAHEGRVPIETLYAWCRKARDILVDEWGVSRVIARPFTGEPGSFQRTARRRDFSLPPPQDTLLDNLIKGGKNVQAVGKVSEIFAGRGITQKHKTTSNQHGMEITAELTAKEHRAGTLIFTNLVDFDSIYGHRNDIEGYSRALEEFDAWLPTLKKHLHPDDLLIITADHGCDPTWRGTDHTREYVPVLVEGGRLQRGVDLGTLTTLADVGATVAEYLGVCPLENGESFLKRLLVKQ